MKHQELLHLSLVQARDEIEHLTVTPSELLDAYLERLHEKEPAYNAYVTVHEEAARQPAFRWGPCMEFPSRSKTTSI